MAIQILPGRAALNRVKEWIRKPLQYTILRVNTLRIAPEEALKRTQQWFNREASLRGRPSPKAWIHPIFSEAIIVTAWPDGIALLEPSPDKKDLPVVVVDCICANAVLRGSPIFQGGVLAISDNISVNSEIQIDAYFEGRRKWIGYGVVNAVPHAWRRESVSDEKTAEYDSIVEMTKGLSIVPPLPRDLIEGGFAVPHSLPAIVSSRVLDPRPGQRILDFGAGTGYMTTHIAALTSNEAEIIAVDHSRGRIKTLTSRCKLLGAKVRPVHSSVQDFAAKETVGFDRIMVNPDHANSGVRPSVAQFTGGGRNINTRIREFVEIAVNLLKPGGRLVYCTGSLLPVENDAVIRWLVDRRQDLKLEPAEPRLAQVGVRNTFPTPSWIMLTPDEEKLVQRFGPGSLEVESDPVHADVPGFFIACFTKVR